MLKHLYWFLTSILVCLLAASCYQASRPVSTRNINSVQTIHDSLKLESISLGLENKKARELRREIAQPAKIHLTAVPAPDKKQRDIYKAITPYLNNAGLDYELIPASFPIKDTLIVHLVQQFNQAESAKQHLLSGTTSKSMLTAANYKIITLKELLLAALNPKVLSSFNKDSKAIQRDSLSIIVAAINREALVYANLNEELRFLSQNPVAKIRSADSRPAVNKFSNARIYISACLAALLLLAGILYYVRKYIKMVKVQPPVNDEDDARVFGTITGDDNGLQQIAEKIKWRVAGRNKTMLVTSLTDTIDKSALCHRLAIYLTKIRIRVVIVNLNFDEDQLGDWTSSNDPGIKDFIFNKVDKIEEMIISKRNPGISTISRGRDYFNVAPGFIGNTHIVLDSIYQNQKKLIINSPKLAFITEKLAQKFDCVVLNATGLNDPEAVLPLTDLTVLNLVAIENSIDNEYKINQVKQLIKKYSIYESSILITD